MSLYSLKYKPLYLVLLSSVFLGACASFPNQYDNGNDNSSYNSTSTQPMARNSELDSLTQSLKDTDNQMALNKRQRNDNTINNYSTQNNLKSSSNSAVYASQYANKKNLDPVNNGSNNLNSNSSSNSNDSNVVITIERPPSMSNNNLSPNVKAISHDNDGDTLVDNRSNGTANSSFNLENNNSNNSNVVIEMEPKKQEQKMNIFDIVDDSKTHNDISSNVTHYSTSETMLASNFASRSNQTKSNFRVNLDWNDSVDLLFTKLSGKAGYQYATINHPRKNMVVSIHGDSLSFDDILRQAGDQISNCFDVVKIQSENVFTLKPKGICQIN